MAAIEYKDDHNKIAYLGRERGCEDFTDILRDINEFFLESDEEEQIGLCTKLLLTLTSDDELIAEDLSFGVETVSESASSPPRSRSKHLGVRSDDFLWDKLVEDFFSSESESNDDMENYISPLPYGYRRQKYFTYLKELLPHSLHPDDVEDFWRTQDEWIVSSWKLYPKSSVHVLDLTNGKTVLTVPPSYCRDVVVAGNIIQTVQAGLRQAYECIASAPIACTARQMVFSSPWLTAKKESGSPLQTALVCNSNPLMVARLPKTGCPEQTATGKDMSNPLYGCDGLPKTVRVFQFTLDSRSEKLDCSCVYLMLLFWDIASTVSAACIVAAGYIVSAGICDAAGSFNPCLQYLAVTFTYPNPNPSASPSFTQDDTSESFIPEPTQPMPTFTQTAFSQPAVNYQQLDVKSAFLYGEIEEEVYVTQPKGFEDPYFPKHVYRVVKALYGLHQAPRAWYARLSAFLLQHNYRRGTIDKTLFIKKDSRDILLVQVYVDDIIFGSTNKAWCDEFEVLMKGEFEMSAMGEMTFFLGLQVKQLPDGIFISQDKYVKDMLTKFDMESVRTATTPYEAAKTKLKDETDPPVNVHLYRSMIGSLMYLTASRPDIMFAVSACSRHQVTPLTSHLNAVKKIFKYLKGQPKLGLWYPKDSPFQLEAYSDSDYAGSHGDRKSTTGGCQFLGRRLISWQCKKQTIVATSSTEAEYVAAASCCAQVLWIQNQLLDYGFNFMNTKIFIDNQSTICIVKNPVFHQRTKHIEIRHHFIRDANEKNLIQVLKIHTDDNVADLLTKAFDGPRFAYLVVHIGMVVNTAARCTFFLLTGLVSAGRTMVLLVVILSAGRLVSAGRTMVLLVVILPAGCFVFAGCMFLLSAWFLLLHDSFCWLNIFMLLELFMLPIHLFMLLNWSVLFAIAGSSSSIPADYVSAGHVLVPADRDRIC
ncbi:putative ribonuclease H-like domain-containing protein [Tanacetum coccineum]|uniref:Ribonuclease H-like domain-containing protein n=1 Tax=Tanacetum coccineum TaxID=301880 RepID=A0ABQ5I564_9ASTR